MDEIVKLVGLPVEEPDAAEFDEAKQNTGPLGGNGGIIAAIVAFLGLGGFLAFFTDFFDIIFDFIGSLF